MGNESLGLSSFQVAQLCALYRDAETIARAVATGCAERRAGQTKTDVMELLRDTERIHQNRAEVLKWARAELIALARTEEAPPARRALPPRRPAPPARPPRTQRGAR